MSLTTIIAIYFLIWWVTLFAVLPWGVRSQHETGDIAPGTEPGAPVSHRIGRVVLRTTLVATAIFAVLAVLYRTQLIPFDWIFSLANPPRR